MPARSLDKIVGGAGSIAAARKMVRALTHGHPDDVSAVAELLTDELLTNAVVHGGGEFTLAAGIEGGWLRVVVSDSTPTAPVTVFGPGHDLDGGRGMTIVNSLATRWGVERSGSDKAIWFELALA